jgi:hypothetical protein
MVTKKQKKLAEKAKADLQYQIDNYNIEVAHENADRLLCEFLKEIGFDEVVKVYNNVTKWYA